MPELRLPVRRGRRRLVLWLVVGLGLLIFFISPLVGLLAEWPWFSALGYERVFATRLVASFARGVLLIFFISPLVGLLVQWPWFSILGYERVIATRLVA